MENNKSLDIFGIKPIGETLNTTVNKTFQGIEGFLKSVCLPAFDEVGLMLKDHIRYWRLNNILKILDKAKGKLEFENDNLQIKAHPRVALAIIENGSLNDNDEVQELWAGLFASSCTESGADDENLIFVDLLKQLTVAESRILKFASENARKIIHPNGLVTSDFLEITCENLIQITGIENIHRLDRELDHLRSMELIGHGLGSGGFSSDDHELKADISPTPLALNLFVRSQGFTKSMDVFWQKDIIPYEQIQKEEEDKRKLNQEKNREEAQRKREEAKAIKEADKNIDK